MGRKKRNRETDRRKRRRTENRREREEQVSEEKEHRNPMGIPDSPMPTNPIPDATVPSAKPPGAMATNPIPETNIRSLGSRGYGPESQQHILRATEETATDPHDLPDPVLDVLASGTGKSLDASIQRELEERMNADYSNVRIHTGSEAAKAADAIDAKAFTCGNAIVFNEGEYDPDSVDGQYLLAHELAHVKQQTGAAISMMPQADADLEIDPDPQLEREADQAVEEALEGGEPLVVNRMGTDVHIQRMPEAEQLEAHRERLRGSSTSDGIAADPEVLAREVEQLKANQEQVLEVLSQAQPGAPAEGEWGETATKGLLGSLASMGTGAAFGAAVGSFFPGLGTAAGAAVGTGLSGVVGDLVKQTVGWTSDNLLDEKAANLEQMYEEISRMYEELKEGTDTGQTQLRDL